MASSSKPTRESSREPLLRTADRIDDSIRVRSQDVAVSKHFIAANVDRTKAKQVKENLQKYEQLFGADEDAFVQPTTTRKELWSYYLYYNVRNHYLVQCVRLC
jgi:hypothetical protein